MKWISEVVDAVLNGGAKRATKYLSPTSVVNATFFGIRRKGDTHKMVMITVGQPNYAERAYIKKLRKIGQSFPVKKIILKGVPILALCLLPLVAQAQWGPSLCAGAGVGYGVSGPEQHQTFVFQFAGLKIKQLDQGAVYACFQRGFVQGSDVGGIGGRLALADQWESCPRFTWILGLGFLDNLQPLQDQQPLKVGLTFDGGLSYDATKWIDVGVYGNAWDRGGRADWFVSLFATLKDPQRLIPGIK